MEALDASVLFPILTENASSASSQSEMLTLGLRWTYFVMLRRRQMSIILNNFSIKEIFEFYEIKFSASMKMNIVFLFSYVVHFISVLKINCTCIPEVNPLGHVCRIIGMYCWILSFLLLIFYLGFLNDNYKWCGI